jgi:hypothetical protein
MDPLEEVLPEVNAQIPESCIKRIYCKNPDREVGNVLNIEFENGKTIGIVYSRIYGFVVD